MIVAVDGHQAHASTGGVELSGTDPVVLLIHGAGMDSTVWQLQTRYLAHRGLRAVAVDLPGREFKGDERTHRVADHMHGS
jgi:pimeloyl-ACP methyl ester carboxylesterase